MSTEQTPPHAPPPGGWHRAGLADPNRPERYLRSRTGLLHVRATYGVVEDDGMSDSIAACGVDTGDGGYVRPVIPAEGRPVCRRCVRSLS